MCTYYIVYVNDMLSSMSYKKTFTTLTEVVRYVHSIPEQNYSGRVDKEYIKNSMIVDETIMRF